MTQYDLIKANQSLFRLMVDNGIMAKDVQMLQILEDAERIEADKEKRQYMILSLAEKYNISPRSVYNTLARLKKEVVF